MRNEGLNYLMMLMMCGGDKILGLLIWFLGLL